MKKRLCILLSSLMILFNICTPVYADVPSGYFQTRDVILQFIQDVGYIGSLPVKGLQVMVTEFLNKMGLGEEAEEITSDEKALEWINNGVYVQGDQINVTGNQWLFFKDLMQTEKAANAYTIGYSTNYSRLSSDYQNVKNAFSSYQRTRICLPNGTGSMLLIPKQCYFVGNLTPDSEGFYRNLRPYYKGVINIVGERVVYAWGSSASAWTQDYSNFNCYASSVSNNYMDPNKSFPSNYSVVGAEGFQYSFYVFQSTSAVGNDGLPKYFIKDSYNTNMTKDSYNTTKHNVSNSLSYGDVINYISENTINNIGPSPTEINIYINEYEPPEPTPTPTPTPTTIPDNPSSDGTVSGNTNNGGSASASASATANNSGVNVTVNNNHNINFNVPGLSGNSTVSGNGSVSGGIFDWISDIGGVIGDFIKNVGQLIADVIKGITETITTVLADIPNIISVLVEFVYGGLPDELKAIVTLGITTVIFVGVIKMMRK